MTRTSRKCLSVYAAAGATVSPDSETKLTLELANGGRIVALPGREGTVRGYSAVTLLLVDEASRVDDALYHSVRPMLAVSGGRLIAMSTPFGKRGWWYDALTSGGPAWERVTVTAHDCPRISPAFLAEEEASMPRWFYLQEYECAPQEDTGAVFAYADIEAAFTSKVRPLFEVS